MTDIEKICVRQSEEYKRYISALCHRSSTWIPKIAKQYATKAFELYQNETIRKVVLAYGEEVEKAKKEYLRQFSGLSENPEATYYSLESSCLINDKEYGKTIDLLFDIKF